MDCCSCCLGCAKYLLFVFNFIFWLSGIAIIGVGIWFLVDPNVSNYVKIITSDSNDPMFQYASYTLIAFGAFVFLIGFLGCCGAIRESQCMLGFYIFFLLIIMGGELAAGILVVIYRGKLESELDQTLQNSIKMDYNDSSVSAVGKAWDFAQYEFKCCGAININDYENSKWSNRTGKKLPTSCCTRSDYDQDFNSMTDDKIVNIVACQNMTGDYHGGACKSKLEEWLQSKAIILIGVGIGISCLQIFGIVFAFCVCCNARRAKE